MTMTAPLRIALAGLGTVGTGVIRLIEENGAMIEQRAGRPIIVSAVSARDSTWRWPIRMMSIALWK